MNGTALRKPTARRVVGMVAGIVTSRSIFVSAKSNWNAFVRRWKVAVF